MKSTHDVGTNILPFARLIFSCSLIGRTKAALLIYGLRADSTVTQQGSSGTIHGKSSSILIGKVDILLQL